MYSQNNVTQMVNMIVLVTILQIYILEHYPVQLRQRSFEYINGQTLHRLYETLVAAHLA